MFFKSALIYRFTQPIPLRADALIAALSAKQHREPASHEVATYGFIPPFEACPDVLVQSVDGAHLITAKKTERNLPGSVVRDALKKKVAEIEAEQMRKVYKKERDQLKDDIVQTLLPQAFFRHKVTSALILDDMVVVDASSPAAAEDLLSTLREALGSLPVRPLTVKIAPTATLSDWLREQKTPTDFYTLDEAELRDTAEDGGLVRVKRQDMTSDEVKLHLSAGKVVTKLSLAWQDKLSLLLDDKLAIKRLRFEDILHDKAEADGGEDAIGQMIASVAILAGTLTQFVPALTEALGGEEIPQGI